MKMRIALGFESDLTDEIVNCKNRLLEWYEKRKSLDLTN
jgi:hypothetical protein